MCVPLDHLGAAYLRYALCGFTRAREYQICRVNVKRARCACEPRSVDLG
jgi:hypothetical protein